MADSGATVMRSRRSEGRLRRWHCRHSKLARHKGLRLGIEVVVPTVAVIPIVAAGNGVLALGVVGIDMNRKLSKSVGNPCRSRSRRRGRRRRVWRKGDLIKP